MLSFDKFREHNGFFYYSHSFLLKVKKKYYGILNRRYTESVLA